MMNGMEMKIRLLTFNSLKTMSFFKDLTGTQPFLRSQKTGSLALNATSYYIIKILKNKM